MDFEFDFNEDNDLVSLQNNIRNATDPEGFYYRAEEIVEEGGQRTAYSPPKIDLDPLNILKDYEKNN